MDIDVTLVEDSRRLAKQCKMKDLIEELENKCKKVYQFGETFIFTMELKWPILNWRLFNSSTCVHCSAPHD